MPVATSLRPGRPGTRRLFDRFGQRLVCVRYRFDPVTRRRIKTIELVVTTYPSPPPPLRLVRIRLEFHESELRAQVKAAGGIWLPHEKLWVMPRAAAQQLGLTARAVK